MNRALEQKSKSVRLQRVTLNKITTDDKTPESKRRDTSKRDNAPKCSKPPVWAVATICGAAVLLVVAVYLLVFSGEVGSVRPNGHSRDNACSHSVTDA